MSAFSIKKILKITAQIFFLIVLLCLLINPFIRRRNINSTIQDTEVHGRVTSSHGGYSKTDNYVGINNSYEIRTSLLIRKQIAVGDSIFKEKGDSFYTVKKQLTGERIRFYVWGLQ